MKISDIKMLMPCGSYEVNVHLGYIESWLKYAEEEYGLELNPDFQRGNVWTEEQQIKYVEFFLRGGKTANIIYFNCPQFDMGSCERIKNADVLPMQCIDGLQRLTALRKFIKGNLKVFGNNTIDDFEDKKMLLRRYDTLKFNVNNMQTKADVIKWYLDFNTGGTIHSEEEISRVKKLLDECE